MCDQGIVFRIFLYPFGRVEIIFIFNLKCSIVKFIIAIAAGIVINFKIFINVAQVPSNLIYDYLDKENPDTLGLGLYKSFDHADGRVIKCRW